MTLNRASRNCCCQRKVTQNTRELTASNVYECSGKSCWHEIKMCSVLPEPVEGGTAAMPRCLLLLCISNLWAIWQNPLVLSVTIICVCVCIWEIFTLSFKMPNRLNWCLLLFSQMLKEQWVRVTIKKMGIFPPVLSVLQKLLSVICDQYIWSWHFQLKHLGNINDVESS